MKNDFEETFSRFDVLDEGFIVVEQMGRFLKFLVKDQTIPIEWFLLFSLLFKETNFNELFINCLLI